MATVTASVIRRRLVGIVHPFADGRLIYRNGSSEFVATRIEP